MANELTAYLYDGDSRRVIREAEPQATVRRGTVRTAAQACQTEPSSDIVLVDLDGEQNPMAHVVSLLAVCRPQSMILATGSENNVTLANDLYRGGVFLYLPKPLDANDVRRAMAEVLAGQDADARPEIQSSRLVLVLGKGMGMTTVTALLARLASERGRYVSCVDLDASFGTLALALDTQPQRGLGQALASPMDTVAVDRLQARVSARIGLVAHPLDQAGQRDAGRQGLPGLIDALSSQAHVILATGATLQDIEALRYAATNHIIVFEPTPAGVSVAARWLQVLDGAPSTLFQNQARQLPPLLNKDHLRDGLGGRVPDAELPYIKSMPEAMALGEPERAIPRRERQELDRTLNTLVGLGTGGGEAT